MLTPLIFSNLFPGQQTFHGMFNRHGGVSPAPYNSLNVSRTVNDDLQLVQKNRRLIKKNLGAEVLISGQQIHESNIYVAEKMPGNDEEIPGFDAFITNIPGIGLMIQQADCQAVMLFDPEKKVVANIHCGWRGSVANIIAETISLMQKKFSSNPANLLAAISPSLGPCCAEFINHQSELPSHFQTFQVKPNYFDFWDISRQQLCETGVKKNNISTASICTSCNQDWFSYRREGTTGRFCSVVGLKAV